MVDRAGSTPGTRMRKECEERLRRLVPTGEAVAAAGTAEELRELHGGIGSGSGWTFLVVTSERVLFAKWGESPKEPHQEIRLDEVTNWADGTQYNAYAAVLTHPPMTRRERVPAHKILWFKWGNARAGVTRTQTIFRFSRADTKAAKAIRAALEKRRVPHEVLHFEERSREERIRGSHVLLTVTAEPTKEQD